MADTTTTPDSEIEQRRQATNNYIHEMDYHVLTMDGLMRATACLVGEIQNDMGTEDARSDYEAFVTMFFLIRDRVELMVESTNRREE